MNVLNLGVSSCAGTKGLHVRCPPASAGPFQQLRLVAAPRPLKRRCYQVFSQSEAAAGAGTSKPSESAAVEVQSGTAETSTVSQATKTSTLVSTESATQAPASDVPKDKGPKESAPASDVQVQASPGQSDEWSPTQIVPDWDAVPEKSSKGPWFLLATIFGLSVVTWQLNKVISETNAAGGFPWQKRQQQVTSTSASDKLEALSQVKARARQLSSDASGAVKKKAVATPNVATSAAIAAAATPASTPHHGPSSDAVTADAVASASDLQQQQAGLQHAIEEARAASAQSAVKEEGTGQQQTAAKAVEATVDSSQAGPTDSSSSDIADAVKLALKDHGQSQPSTNQQTSPEPAQTKIDGAVDASSSTSSNAAGDHDTAKSSTTEPVKPPADSTQQTLKQAADQGTFTGLNAGGSIFNRHQPPPGSSALPEAGSAFTGLYSPLHRPGHLSTSGRTSSTRSRQQPSTSTSHQTAPGAATSAPAVQSTVTQGPVEPELSAALAAPSITVTVAPAPVPIISKAVESSVADRMTADRTVPALREKAAVALRAAAAAGEASQRASAYAAAASSAASRAAEAAQRAADAAVEAQAELETCSEAAITACERRAARAASVAQEAEARAAGAAAVATSYEDVGSTQASIAEKAARLSKPAPEPSTTAAGSAAAPGGVALPDLGSSSQALLHSIQSLWKTAVDGVTGAMKGHSSSH